MKISDKELYQFYKNICSTRIVSFEEFKKNYNKMDTKTEEIVYPDRCPKCRSNNVLCSDWKDMYLIYLNTTCQDCYFSWRETIDLTI